MISAKEKKFFFHTLCLEVMNLHDLAFYDPTSSSGKVSVEHMDTSRIAAFEKALAKLVGCCIPYKYQPDCDFKEGVIRIYHYDTNRNYLVYHRGEGQRDVDD